MKGIDQMVEDKMREMAKKMNEMITAHVLLHGEIPRVVVDSDIGSSEDGSVQYGKGYTTYLSLRTLDNEIEKSKNKWLAEHRDRYKMPERRR